jgi:hypothetical protein
MGLYRMELTKKDKTDGYGDSQRRRLTNIADKALSQVEKKLYRAQMQPHVTNFREYGIAFLGSYCAVATIGRSLERKPGEAWVVAVQDNYTSAMYEKRRSEWYHANAKRFLSLAM